PLADGAGAAVADPWTAPHRAQRFLARHPRVRAARLPPARPRQPGAGAQLARRRGAVMSNEDRSHKYAIVGAGFSGLGVAAAFTRHGIDFDVLEADDDLGGNWYHGVYETVHIISSRKTTEYSDLPMPAHWPDFP